MDVKKEKSDLIKWLSEINDRKVIKQFVALRNANMAAFGDKLTPSQKEAIEKGLKSIDEGKTITHDKVMKMTKTRYPGLFK